MMNEGIQKVINASIGAIKTAVEDVDRVVQDYVAKGAAANDPTSAKIKELVRQAFAEIEKTRSSVESNVKMIGDKLQSLMPGSQYQELMDKLNNITHGEVQIKIVRKEGA